MVNVLAEISGMDVRKYLEWMILKNLVDVFRTFWVVLGHKSVRYFSKIYAIHVHFYVIGHPASIYKTGYIRSKTYVIAEFSICVHPVGHEIITHTLSRPPTNERALFHKPVLQSCQSRVHSGTGYYIIACHL